MMDEKKRHEEDQDRRKEDQEDKHTPKPSETKRQSQSNTTEDSDDAEKRPEADAQDEETPEEKRRREKQLEELMDTLRRLEEEKRRSRKQKQRAGRVIMIEFGSVFHHNPLLNFAMYFLLNLVVFVALFELLGFIDFGRELQRFLLFVLTYTFLETLFRNYVLFNHFRFVLRTMGFILFFGYLTLFFLLEQYLFDDIIAFASEAQLIVFVGMFIVIRYLLSHLIRHIILKAMG